MFKKSVVSISLIALFCSASMGQEQTAQTLLEAQKHAAIGQFSQSNAICNGLLEKSKLPEEEKESVYAQLRQNYWLAGDYKKYYEVLSASMDRKSLKQYDSYKKLSKLPPESLVRPHEDISVVFKVDTVRYDGVPKGFLILVPVGLGGRMENIILDNGLAQTCIANESFAKSHGIKPTGATGSVGGSGGGVSSVWWGVLDKMTIGKMELRNVLFVVVPDEATKNPVRSFDAILGANIFRLVGEMDFDVRNRTISFPYEQKDVAANLYFTPAGHHYADVKYGTDTISMMLDMGASSTGMSERFYKQYEKQIVKECTVDSVRTAGIGGTKYELGYKMPELNIEVCGGSFTGARVPIDTSSMNIAEGAYGLLGADFFLSFNRFAINIQKMYFLVF